MNTKFRVIVQIQSRMRLSCLQYNITNGYLQSIARESKYIFEVQIYSLCPNETITLLTVIMKPDINDTKHNHVMDPIFIIHNDP